MQRWNWLAVNPISQGARARSTLWDMSDNLFIFKATCRINGHLKKYNMSFVAVVLGVFAF